jgi:hypothetical protein
MKNHLLIDFNLKSNTFYWKQHRGKCKEKKITKIYSRKPNSLEISFNQSKRDIITNIQLNFFKEGKKDNNMKNQNRTK